MSVLVDKLLFVAQRRALSYVKAKTTLSTYAIRQFKLGHLLKVSLDRFSINAMYRTEAYRYARQAGFSSVNATRVRDWSVSRMKARVDIYTNMIDNYASKVITQKAIRDRLKNIYKDYNTYYQENIDWIKDAYRKNKYDLEEWEDHEDDSP